MLKIKSLRLKRKQQRTAAATNLIERTPALVLSRIAVDQMQFMRLRPESSGLFNLRGEKMILQLAVKKKYFDEIASGVKTEEFRMSNAYWMNRLKDKDFEKVVITLGYPKKDDQSRRLEFKWSGYSIKTITHEHFDNKPVTVYAIKLIESLKS